MPVIPGGPVGGMVGFGPAIPVGGIVPVDVGGGPDAGAPIEVVIRGFPLRLYLDLQQHNDALMREFALIAEDAVEDVPGRLLALARDLQRHFAEATGTIRAQIAAAVAEGRTTTDLLMPVPVAGVARPPADGRPARRSR